MSTEDAGGVGMTRLGRATWKALFRDFWHELKTLKQFSAWLERLVDKMDRYTKRRR